MKCVIHCEGDKGVSLVFGEGNFIVMDCQEMNWPWDWGGYLLSFPKLVLGTSAEMINLFQYIVCLISHL